ncbi:ABC transporter ATP-binding protein [Schaalia sp. 19OD2882]|uniref:ABC transporter ATP-binding protein n=1 Tax=Schaalia sp. 19OD2882 TaxID=2794089 RepID=UPI001C1F0C9A|nr:ABC transporter ATP-binding protein [Schaalia sp. 19OD2882]QWW20106.1 ABC transporter ATP-binding protein [Schaalia sp. 19OD2882]
MERPTVTSPAAQAAVGADDAISLHRVVRTQGTFTLGPLDMHVPAGLVTGFVGPNGAGKTTTIKAMLGMTSIDSGSIRVLGNATGACHERIGVVLDALALSTEWTADSAARTLARFYPTWDQPYYESLLRRMDVPTHTKVRNLSRGQGVKLQLALALAHRPELLILDEPTSGLDPVARLDVLDVFREYLVDEGRTILFSTHITSDLERIADHLHIIGAGRTCFEGSMVDFEEGFVIARGPLSLLDGPSRAALIGMREHSGSFEGLVRVGDTAVFGPQVVIETAQLDEAVASFIRDDGRPRTDISTSTTKEH